MESCFMAMLVLALFQSGSPPAELTRAVNSTEALHEAIAQAKPGSTILIAPGTYRGGLSARGLRGEPDRPVILKAADPKHPPVFQGSTSAFHFSDVSHLQLHNLAVVGASGNGINIDDGGSYNTPSHHVLLKDLVIRDIGPDGNHDGIKLSGVDDFRVENCTLERWGNRGSGIDMVGCHRGEVVGCTFRHGDTSGDSGVQAKGGSSEVAIRNCRFEHAGQRAINLGGSTGLPYFRPAPRGYEAKDLIVEDCAIIGSTVPIAFIGIDGAVVRHNTIYRPRRWVIRILQETRDVDFVPCRNGQFSDNLIAYRSDELTVPVNIGDKTAPETFMLARNAWYCLDAPNRSRPRLPIQEGEGRYGIDPRFRDAENGDLRLRPDSLLRNVGVRKASEDATETRP